jgi:hypothetical protein
MSDFTAFADRQDGARRLAERFRGRALRDPLVLAIPRGGAVTGAVLARELGAELDVVVVRKLRHPDQPELAIGAVSEQGRIYLNPEAEFLVGVDEQYLEQEGRRQRAEIARRTRLFRAARPPAAVRGRSVIVVDDGIATGATMIAALQVVRTEEPHELIAAAPVASPDRVREIRRWCDQVICVYTPARFRAIGEFYEDFTQVDEQQVVQVLSEFAPAARRAV